MNGGKEVSLWFWEKANRLRPVPIYDSKGNKIDELKSWNENLVLKEKEIITLVNIKFSEINDYHKDYGTESSDEICIYCKKMCTERATITDRYLAGTGCFYVKKTKKNEYESENNVYICYTCQDELELKYPKINTFDHNVVILFEDGVFYLDSYIIMND